MKTDFLKDLGLEQDAIDKIMAENGKDIEAVKTKYADYDDIKRQVADRDTQLEDLKKLEPEKLQSEITRLQGENATSKQKYEEELKNARLNYALETKLTKEGAVNTKAVRALLDSAKISLDGENLIGVDEQLKALKETEKWAFTTPAVPGAGGNPAPSPETKKPPLPSGTVIF